MVVASIDLMDGKAVQLRQGKDKILERNNPIELAKKFDRFGEVAVIDLDAAMGKGNNLPLIKKILNVAECRVGGGIRTLEQAKELISLGASKVIIGSKAFEHDQINHSFLKELSDALTPQQLIVAIDARDERIVTKAWTHQTELQLYETAGEIEQYASEFLFTCVEREGTLRGSDLDMVERLKASTQNKITVAGGVQSIEEIRQLAALGMDVQLGMALYTGKIELAEAFIESLDWKNGLLPTVVQDITGQVLMLAYANSSSLQSSFETGQMCYYSRSRQKLWTKGETSGNIQKLVRLRADCDRDTLLAVVDQTNVACHNGSYSCFGDKQFTHQELYEVIRDRLEHPRTGSYTAKLTDTLLNEKILEEARELVEARERSDIIWEFADLLYFSTVLLAKHNIEITDVLHELRRRRRK
ncbi:MAG: bifunctional phosphoribosyl-AMP cyclohydrolase/phosphoribosyl-ATP diphosphatase HisIE [bacterium]